MGIQIPAVGRSYANTDASRSVASKPQTPQPATAGAEVREVAKGNMSEHDKESQKELLEQTTSLLRAFDRSLKYDVIEEAGILQIKVLDSRDGSVVRKIPADEVVKLVTQIRKKLIGKVQVEA
jgi:uncharacterized FlaG/YvyC family protein